jgi:hypothetical protein
MHYSAFVGVDEPGKGQCRVRGVIQAIDGSCQAYKISLRPNHTWPCRSSYDIGVDYKSLLLMSVVLNFQVTAKLDVAIPTPVAGMFFKDTCHKIIENHDKPYAKRSLAE